MQNEVVTIAQAYYHEMAQKNLGGIEKYIDSNIEFVGPLAKLKGKEAMLASIKGFMNVFNTLNTRAIMVSEDQAMIAYDLECPIPIGIVHSAALMTVKKGFITRLELFFDARPFVQK